MDQVEVMMEGLAIDDQSSLYEYIDFEYEFDAYHFFDFCIDETEFDVQKAERWFRYAREYPPAPYMMKINLTNVLKNTPPKVHTTSSLKLEAGRHVSPSIVTPSDCGMPSSEEKTEADSGLKYPNLFADDPIAKSKSKSTNRSSKSSKTFMKPTASHLAKQISPVDFINTGSCGRSPKQQTPTGCEPEDTKKQKLEIGFLRKVSQLKHQTSFSHKKATIPQTPKLMTEERARRRSFKSQTKAEASIHTFKALPLNRRILESPSFPSHKKSMSHLPEFQKFHFTYDS